MKKNYIGTQDERSYSKQTEETCAEPFAADSYYTWKRGFFLGNLLTGKPILRETALISAAWQPSSIFLWVSVAVWLYMRDREGKKKTLIPDLICLHDAFLMAFQTSSQTLLIQTHPFFILTHTNFNPRYMPAIQAHVAYINLLGLPQLVAFLLQKTLHLRPF